MASTLLRREMLSTKAVFQGGCAKRYVLTSITQLSHQSSGFSLVQASLWRHASTNLEHLHIQKEDTNKVFAIGFRTPPVDCTGTPHILEHTTLCGSESYPVRDPFFKMLNRSLATYLNAFTATDYTFYPFSTINDQDYRNLREVYLDAVLHPLLKKQDFEQEGWRLEHQDVNDPKSPIQFKGVVFNEMKGQMSDASYLFYILYQRELFPGTIYANDSGGDPQHIPSLSHEELVLYHQRYYHPSNAKLFTFGTTDISEIHQSVDEKLRIYEAATVAKHDSETFTPQHTSRKVVVYGPKDDMAHDDRQFKASISYQCAPLSETYELFKLKLLATLLLDGHAAPLYKSLVVSQLASEYSPNTGLDTSTKISVFSVGIHGSTEEACNNLQAVVETVFRQVKNDGFPTARIDGIMHQLELALLKPSVSFGMNLLQKVATGWMNGLNPLDHVSYQEHVERFKHEANCQTTLLNMLDKYFLSGNGPHLHFTMKPDHEYEHKNLRAEQALIQDRLALLSQDERHALMEKGKELVTAQTRQEDLSCLPSLSLKDIPEHASYVALEHSLTSTLNTYWNFTASDLTYFRFVIDTTNLPDELQPFLPLFADCFSHLGTQQASMADIEEEVRLRTGGFAVTAKVNCSPRDRLCFTSSIIFSSLCLSRNIEGMFTVMSKLFHHINFENTDSLRTLLRSNASALNDTISDSGHQFAMTRAAAAHSSASSLLEKYHGLSQLAKIYELSKIEELLGISHKLKEIHNFVLSGQIKCFITTKRQNQPQIEHRITELLPSVASVEQKPIARDDQGSQLPTRILYKFPFAVSHAALSFGGCSYVHEDGPALQVLAKLLSTHYLHTELREKAGAYGAGARYNALMGTFDMYTYRDPDAYSSIQTMLKSCEWLMSQSWTASQIEQAKLSIFQAVDAPVSEANKGLLEFSDGVTAEMRKNRRTGLLNVSTDDLKSVTAKYLVEPAKRKLYSACVLGSLSTPEAQDHWTIHNLSDISSESLTIAATQAKQPQILDQFEQCIRNPRYDSRGKPQTVHITDRARVQLNKISEQKGLKQYLRIALESGGCHGYQYVISLTDDLDATEDVVFEVASTPVIVDESTLELIADSEVDYTDELIGSEFKVVNNPRAISKCGCDTSIDIDIGTKG